MKNYKLVLADDHPLVLEETRRKIETMEGVTIVGCAKNGQECLDFVDRYGPDMVVLDYLMPDLIGTELAARIAHKWPHIKTVILSGFDMSPLMDRFRELHIKAVIEKGVDPLCLRSIIHCALCNRIIFPDTPEAIFAASEPSVDIEGALSKDELRVLNLTVDGRTVDQIAAEMFMSSRSVHNYITRICKKMNVDNKMEVVRLFIRSKYYLGDSRKEDMK